jgi:hypothetical protein
MEFKLGPPRRDIPDSDLLKDLVEVCERLNKESIGQEEYDANGRFSSGTFRKRFGSWSAALEKAGRKALRWHNVTKEEYLDDIRRVAQLLGKRAVTMAEYDELGKYCSSAAIGKDKFGSWFAALDAAGLQRTRNLRITDEELFLNLEKVWRTLGRQPIGADLRKPLSSYSVDAYGDRFRTWRKALEAFVTWVNQDDSPNEPVETEPSVQSPITVKAFLPRGRRSVSDRLRIRVMFRDDYRCRMCGNSPALERGVILHVDHKVPWSKGGKTELNNLQTLCMRCNLGKGDWTPL